MIPDIVIQMSSARIGTPVWITSGMGHWQEMTKITDVTDYY